MKNDSLAKIRLAIATFLASSVAIGLLLTMGAPRSQAQQGPSQCTMQGTFATCSPTQLGDNAIALPISGTTALSNVIDLTGVTNFNLWSNCGQTYTTKLQFYAEDGTTAFAVLSADATVTASTDVALSISQDQAPNASAGTVVATLPRLPQKAVAFQFTNGTASGSTCTARLFLGYH
jgi:hypothetical protein